MSYLSTALVLQAEEAAAPESIADLIAILTPGVERFDCLRVLGRIQRDLKSFDTLLPEQER